MEKIITIQYNTKIYNPNDNQAIISGYIKNVLLSNKNEKLISQKGKYLIYGK